MSDNLDKKLNMKAKIAANPNLARLGVDHVYHVMSELSVFSPLTTRLIREKDKIDSDIQRQCRSNFKKKRVKNRPKQPWKKLQNSQKKPK